MGRNWTKLEVQPGDILSGARTLERRKTVWTMDLVPDWKKAEEYLSWARTALAMDTPLGHDAAVCYAKRAICRMIDSLMHYNHLRRWVGDNYPRKIDLLKQVGIDIKSIVYELVIDSRNDIEHSYTGATAAQARHAVEIAEMAIPPLASEADIWAIVTLGLNYGGGISGPDPSAPGGYSSWNFQWDAHVPFLLADYTESVARIMLIDRKNEEVRFARLESFDRGQAIDLANQLREQTMGGTVSRRGCNGPLLVQELKNRLELAF